MPYKKPADHCSDNQVGVRRFHSWFQLSTLMNHHTAHHGHGQGPESTEASEQLGADAQDSS